MTDFLHDDFLLKSSAARTLYHEFAAGLPIIDYHNHLDPRGLADDCRFENLTQLWIASDPYKHRAMRIAGVRERQITGDASDREKFDAWAATVPQTLGNPLFHWTALELKRVFGVCLPLNPETAETVWRTGNERLRAADGSARGLLGRFNVECLCTSDRLDDDLGAHCRLADVAGSVRVLPSLRVDETPAGDHEAIRKRLDVFQSLGCRLADHTTVEGDAAMLRFLCGEYVTRGWILQLHLGAQRHTNTRLRQLAGPAGGYATIGDGVDLRTLCRWLDDLEQAGSLPRTIIYPLNPADYAAVATLTGSFAEDGVGGKIQFGPAWWYNDHAWGIRAQIEALASYGLLSTFVGMTTDSRSLVSMVRHEYFRRLLCDWLGDQVQAGAIPNDHSLLGGLVRAVCYENARQWFLEPAGPGR